MRLELEKTFVSKLTFGSQTAFQDGELLIDCEALIEWIGNDHRLKSVELDIAHPGDSCRILQVTDIIEPRFKPDLDKEGNKNIIGAGTTRALKGMAIVLSDRGDRPKMGMGAIIDMDGSAAELSPFSKTCNLVLLLTPVSDLSAGEYEIAMKQAGFKAGTYLAKAVSQTSPDDMSVFDIPPLTNIDDGYRHLPKVVYIPQIFSQQFVPIPGEPVLFGRQAEGIIPSLLHPNQMMDGAVTATFPALNVTTYDFQNPPVLNSLYERHGRDLYLSGVIVTVAPNNVADFDLMADLAASLASHVINADGAILTKCGGGAPELAMARTAQRCEQLGIKTVIAMLNMGADVRDHKYGAATIFNMPEVDALVSMGMPYAELNLPPMDRTIGRSDNIMGRLTEEGEIFTSVGMIKGSMCQLGSSKLVAVRY